MIMVKDFNYNLMFLQSLKNILRHNLTHAMITNKL